MFFFVWVFVFAYRFYENFNSDEYVEQTSNYLGCLLRTQPSSLIQRDLLRQPGVVVPDCELLKASPSRGLFYMVHVVVGGIGEFCVWLL